MGVEIERKFLVQGDAWRHGAKTLLCRQGYLSAAPERAVRVRLMGGKGFLTIKGAKSGASGLEFEYPIPAEDAAAMLDSLAIKPLIEKTRHLVEFAGKLWEIDEFHEANAGLIVAEVELECEDEPLTLPPWIDREVTDDPRYYNAALALRPYASW